MFSPVTASAEPSAIGRRRFTAAWPIVVEDPPQAGRLDPLMHVVVDHDHRGQAAGPEAAAHVERELPVGRGLADFDPQQVAERGQHLLAAANVAGRPQADPHQVLAARHGRKERIEADHPGHFAIGLAQGQADFPQGGLRQVAEHGLGDLKHRNQRPGDIGILCQNLIETRQKFLFGGLLALQTLFVQSHNDSLWLEWLIEDNAHELEL